MAEKKTKKTVKVPDGVGEKQPTPTPAPATPVAKVAGNPAQAMLESAAETKAILAKSPHTQFLVPLAEGEKPGAVETVQINGYKLTIQKGVMVNVPVAVAKLIANKYRIQMTAGQEARVDRGAEVSEALE